MNVLLVGGGGREHALAWKLSQSEQLSKLFCAPGNPGIAEHAELVALDPDDHAAVMAFCRAETIDLVVIGPEAPLVAGLGDALRRAGLLVFGPNSAAARLEGSKGFTKDLCAREGIPTAGFVRAPDAAAARAACARFGVPVVVKADGLAAGKGVTVAATTGEAHAAIDALFAVGADEVLVEEFLRGEEVSLFVLTDGVTVLPLGTAQDHKRVGDGDTGPNTGGMGAYSPAPVLTPALEARALAEIVEPTVRAMAAAGTPFSGVLYAGLMLTAQGPKLIEYNARFGDPEAQVLMLRLGDDLLDLMLATARGRLAERAPPAMIPHVALGVVVAARGYPGAPATGGAVAGIADAQATGAKVFQAGTRLAGDTLVASGGRVLAVCALGADIGEARDAAYRAVDAVRFDDGFHRRDIGWREEARARGGTGGAGRGWAG
ncbi:MAG TPA: phosphoribosylamine--glycine ligase [Sphingomonadaceae bacterium]|jgi:phosphoribosylamine--glycine ligase|nr:phosphoribosylamine--glycine ligase [Sphingomonadaceae bacterium]